MSSTYFIIKSISQIGKIWWIYDDWESKGVIKNF